MNVYEKELKIKKNSSNSLIEYFGSAVNSSLGEKHSPVRFAVTGSDDSDFQCEIGVADLNNDESFEIPSIFEFVKRNVENSKEFNAVLLVPTGIGAEIGGHAGDATPVARLLGSVCDHLITHPNVVNASDLNEMPENTLYVEGSVITRLLMGTIGLSEVRSNRILALIEEHPVDELFTHAAINAINAARASFGIQCQKILKLNPGFSLSAEYSTSGSAVGRVENLDKLNSLLIENQDEYDAIAIASIIKVPTCLS